MSSICSEIEACRQNDALDKAAEYLKKIVQVMHGEETGGLATSDGLAAAAPAGRAAAAPASRAGLSPPAPWPGGLASARSGVSSTAQLASAVSSIPPASSGCDTPQGGDVTATVAMLTLDSDSLVEDAPFDLDLSPPSEYSKSPLKNLTLSTMANSELLSGGECFIGLVQYLVTVLEDHDFPQSKLHDFRSQLVAVVHKLCQIYAMLQLHEGEVDVAGKIQDIVDHEVTAAELTQTTLLLHQREAELRRCEKSLERCKEELQQRDAQLQSCMEALQRRSAESPANPKCGPKISELKLDLDGALRNLRQKDDEMAELRNKLGAALDQATCRSDMDVQQPRADEGFRCTDNARQTHTGLPQYQEDPELLRQQLEERSRALQRLEARLEHTTRDYRHFILQLASHPHGSLLPRMIDLRSAEILSLGSYGHAFICQDRDTGEQVALKVLNQQCVDVAVREWAHGTDVGTHPHIASYKQIVMHHSVDQEVLHCFENGLALGMLQAEQVSLMPERYVCLMFEYMDCGTLHDLMDLQPAPLEWAAAVLRQVALALAFLHGRHCVHGDVGPESIALRQDAEGGGLVVKLADCGSAARSGHWQRDAELLAYSSWCLALGRPFRRCPGPYGRASAVAELRAAGPGCGLREGLAAALDGLWEGRLGAGEVAAAEALRGCEVEVSEAGALRLEERARAALRRRATVRWERRECDSSWEQVRPLI